MDGSSSLGSGVVHGSGFTTGILGPDSLTSTAVGSGIGTGKGSPVRVETRMAGASGTFEEEHSASFCSNEEEHSIGEATGDGGRAVMMLVMFTSDVAISRRNQLDVIIVNLSPTANESCREQIVDGLTKKRNTYEW